MPIGILRPIVPFALGRGRYLSVMPYKWTDAPKLQRCDAWPNRSLSNKGLVTFISITAGFFLIPLLALIGTALLWGLLPFLLVTLGLVLHFIRRNDQDLKIWERLEIKNNLIRITRHNPRGPSQEWQANPYWTRVLIDEQNGPVPNYLTLKGSDKEVELGAFLSPDERLSLYDELVTRINKLDINAH